MIFLSLKPLTPAETILCVGSCRVREFSGSPFWGLQGWLVTQKRDIPRKLPLTCVSDREDGQKRVFLLSECICSRRKSAAQLAGKRFPQPGPVWSLTDGAPSRITHPRELVSHMEEKFPRLRVPRRYFPLEAARCDQA